MAPLFKVTPAVLKAVIPSQTLADLSGDPNDLDNDLHVLIHWLSPFYVFPKSEAHEPSARVKAAAKRCLRDKHVHREFVRLFLNSIGSQFHLHFRDFVAENPFPAIVEHVGTLDSHYRRQVATLNISELALDLFDRGVKALFMRYLNQPHFRHMLDNILNTQFNESSRTWLRILTHAGMGSIVQAATVRISAIRICERVTSLCSGQWDKQLLTEVEQWVRVDLYPIFALGRVDSNTSSSNDLVRNARDELISLRIAEIFDMVSVFPQSQIALNELHQCLTLDSGSQALSRAELVDTFVSKCFSCLLHSGSNTTRIISMYMKTIKAFLVIDPTGVLLDKVARPIRKYLKMRADLVPQLVRGMLDTNPDSNTLVELAEELERGAPSVCVPADDLKDLNWYPDPIDALPDFKRGKILDVVAALTSILSSPDVLVDEFTKLFGDRLLQWDKYSATDVTGHVELLKSRFGANEFATLDVMIRDIQESDAIDNKVNHDHLSLTILSKNYWPTIADSFSESDGFNVPLDVHFEAYSSSFGNLKPGRNLSLIPSLGKVTVQISSEDGLQEYKVTPAQATVIELFDDDMEEISLSTITLATRMSNYTATQALKFWVDEGMIFCSGTTYRALRN